MKSILLVILLLLLAMGGCGGGDDPVTPAPTPGGGSGTIEFLSDQIVVFTAVGQEKALQAVVKDSGGNIDTGAQISWQALDPSMATVTLDGTVTAVGSFGSTLVVASHGSLEPVLVTVVIAELTPRARWIDSSDVVSINEQETQVVLVATDATTAIIAGDVVMSGDKAGVLVRVVSVTASANQITLATEPANLTDFYRHMEIDVSTPSVLYESDWVDSDTKRQVCETQAQIDVNITGFRVRPIFDLGVDFDFLIQPDPLDPDSGELVAWMTQVEGSAGVEIDGGRARLGGRGRIKCKDSGPAIHLFYIPLGGPVGVSPTIKPVWGSVFELELEAVDFDLPLMRHEKSYDLQSFVGWTKVSGLDKGFTMSESGPGATLDEEADIDLTFTLKGKAELFMGVRFGLDALVGPFDLVQIGLVEAVFRAGAALQIDPPFSEEHREWHGMRWDLYLGAEANLTPLLDTVQFADRLLKRMGMDGGLATYLNVDLKIFEAKDPFLSIEPPTLDVLPEDDGTGGTNYVLTATVPLGMRVFVNGVDFYYYDADGDESDRTHIGYAPSDAAQGLAAYTWDPPATDDQFMVKAVTRSHSIPFEQGSDPVNLEPSSCPPGPTLLTLELAGGVSGDCMLDMVWTPDPGGAGNIMKGPGVFGPWEIVCAEGYMDFDELRDPQLQLLLTLIDAEGRGIDLYGTHFEILPEGSENDFALTGVWSVIEGPGSGTAGTFRLEGSG